jgi:hypothetical protein
MDRVKKAKPLTCEQYLKKFSRAVRWRLPPQESEEAIADYRELIFQEERDETKLVEELGEPVQAAHLLTDVRTYRRWLKVFAVLAFGLFLLAKWCWTGSSQFTYVLDYRNYWFPVWVMIVGLVLSQYWFRRYGQKNGPLSKEVVLGLALVLAAGAAIMGWTWYVTGPEFLARLAAKSTDDSLHRLAWTLGDLLMYCGAFCALGAFAGLVLAKCYDRRWLSVYALGLTVAVLCAIVTFWLRSMSLDWGADELRDYFFPRMVLVGTAGLIGTGVALC